MEQNMEQFKAHTQVLSESLCMAGSFAMKCAIELNIPNILHARGDNPVSLQDLANSISIPSQNIDMLRRVMRILANRGIFTQPAENVYGLTTASRLLLFNDSSGMSPFVRGCLDQTLNKSWYYLSEALRSEEGITAFQLANKGKILWEVMKEQPELSALFYEALGNHSVRTMEMAVSQHPEVFSGLESLVDVGGGTGSSSTVITNTFPEISCMVLELPHMIATIPSNEKVKAIEGDMFQYIPPANAMFLKNILHDWNDEDCVKILQKCREAISSQTNGKIIIVDIVINSCKDDKKLTELQLMYDMLMMSASPSGKEREEEEWKKIFLEAGFSNYKISPLMEACSIVELYP
ncbi:hypothetical protein LUZ60_012621 [Juncus effusus]|nr:hypothetical protein LUZ60_012621 [Juncus effusus]